jgi:cytochrome c553
MRSFVRVSLVSCVPFTAALVACGQPPAAQAPSSVAPAAVAPSQVERGRTLVTVGGCHDCHTTKKLGPNGPEPDMSNMLSGHPENIKVAAPFKPAPGSPWTMATNDTLTAWSGPWGVSFAANLTPDRNTGMGAGGPWTEEVFVKALKTGKHLGTSRDILPPMPWNFYAQLSDDDLKAIWAYLQTIPASSNHVPDPIPPAAAAATR